MTFRRHPSVEVLDLDGEIIILNQETLAVTKLNETGGRIWELLSEDMTIDQVTEKIVGEFPDANDGVVREDVEAFVNQMIGIGLIDLAG